MDLATIIGILTAISLLLGILAIIYKFCKLIVTTIRTLGARERKQDGQIKDLFNLVNVQGQQIKQIHGYLAKPKAEQAQKPFFPGSSLEALEQSAVESFRSNKTDFTPPK